MDPNYEGCPESKPKRHLYRVPGKLSSCACLGHSALEWEGLSPALHHQVLSLGNKSIACI